MKATAVLFIVGLLVVQCHTFPVIEAIVKGPVALPCNCSGEKTEWWRLYPTKDSIASCQDGKCEIKPAFRERVSIVSDTSTGNFSLGFSSVFYNDVGVYMCSCNGRSVSEGKLKVYDPRTVEAIEGENITLPCYGDTRRNTNDAQWKKDGNILLTFSSKSAVNATEGRIAMSKKGFQIGDLSLMISSVNMSDTGLYLCQIQSESRDGDPRAVLLKVKQHQPKQQPECQPPATLACCISLGIIILSVIFLVGMLAFSCFVKRRNQPRDQSSSDLRAPVQEEQPMILKPSSTQPIQD